MASNHKIFISAVIGTLLIMPVSASAQTRTPKPILKKPAATQPVSPAQKKLIDKSRQVRNKLGQNYNKAAQIHRNTARTLERRIETERALKDRYAGAKPGTREFNTIRDATRARANAELNVRSALQSRRDAYRQVRTANKLLSAGKKNDWVAAQQYARSLNRSRSQTGPATQPRKITFAKQPLGPTPSPNIRNGRLKVSFKE